MRLFNQALGEMGGHGAATGGTFPGATDPKIVDTKLREIGIEPTAELVSQVLIRLEDLLEEAVGAGATVAPKPGVVALLDELSKDPRFALSVLTGNTLRNAKSKLTAAGVAGYFDLSLGAFGSDSADRNDLVPIALSRFFEQHGRELRGTSVIVIGDTEHDYGCAQAGGVRCILVATGSYGHQELSVLGAELTVSDLSATEEILAVLRA